jgi:hypothetical protein
VGELDRIIVRRHEDRDPRGVEEKDRRRRHQAPKARYALNG